MKRGHISKSARQGKHAPAKERDLNEVFGLNEGAEPEVMARIREHEEFYRKHGYCESDIEALIQLKADLCIDQYPGWSSQPTKT